MATGSRMSCDCSITFVKNDAVPKNVKEAKRIIVYLLHCVYTNQNHTIINT